MATRANIGGSFNPNQSSPGNRLSRRSDARGRQRKLQLLSVTACAVAGLLSKSASAASGSWTGATDSAWADNNWSATPVPGIGDTATFNGLGNAHTNIDLGSGITIQNILFNTSGAAAYNLGTGAIGSELLTLNTSGAITVASTVANNETFDSAVVLGTNSNASTYTFTNNSLTNSLIFASNISGGATGGTAGTQTLTVGGAGNTVISGSLLNGGAGQNLALTKIGSGTLTFNGTTNAAIIGGGAGGGAYGTLAINSGTLALDFSNYNAVGNANLLNSYTPVTLSGGSLQMIGNAANASVQSFNNGSGVTVNPGFNVISLSNNATLNLGAFTQTVGSMTMFNGPAYYSSATGATAVTVPAAGTITTTTLGMNTNLLWPNPRVAIATVGIYNWASVVDSPAGTNNILAGDQVANFYTQVANGATVPDADSNFDLVGNATFTNAKPAFVDTIRFNAQGAYTATTGAGGSGYLFLIGGILVTPNVGANNTTIANGGAYMASADTTTGNDPIDVYQNNTAGELLVNVPLYYYSGTNKATCFVQGGAGTVNLTGQAANNGNYGSTYLNGGTTVISDNSQLGRTATAATLNLNGGTVLGSLNGLSLATRPVSLGGNGGGLASVAGDTMTVGGVITGALGTGPLVIGIPGSSANANTPGLLPGTGSGTANTTPVYATGTVILKGAGNTFTGGAVVTAGATLNIDSEWELGGSNYAGITFNNGTLQYNTTLATGTTVNTEGYYQDISTNSATVQVAQPVTFAGNATIDTNSHSITYANSIGNGGPGKLTIADSVGTGTLTLSAANTYTGGTLINSGTLNVINTTGSATGTGPVTVSGGMLTGNGIITGTVNASGGAIAPGPIGNLTLGGLNYTSGNLNFSLNGSTGLATQISTGSASFFATPSFGAISITGVGSLTNGEVFTVLKSTSPITGGGFLTFGSSANQSIGRFVFTPSESGNSLIFTLTGNPANLLWAGGVSGLATTIAAQGDGSTWSTAQTAGVTSNWNNSGKYDYFYSADNVTFNDSAGAGNHVINLTTANPASSVTVNTASSYTFNGAGSISGAASLNVASGTLNLNTTNTYSGGTLIGSGAKVVTGSGALPTGGSVTLQGTVDLNGTSQTIGSLSSSGTTALITDGVSAAASLTAGGSSTTTYGGVIQNGAGSVALNVSGSGSLAFTGSNTYSGGTTLSGGTLLINNGSAAVTGASAIGTGPLNLSSGTIDSSVAGIVLGTNNPVTISGSFGFGGTNNLNLGSGAVSLAGNSTITLGGTGKTLTLGGVATNTIATAVTTTVNLSATGSSNTLVLGGVALTSGGTALNDVFNGNANINILGPVTDGSAAGSGLTYSGTGTVTLSASNTYTGPTAITGGASLTATQGTLVIPAGASLTTSSSLTVGPGAVLSIAGGTVSLPATGASFVSGGNGTNVFISSGSLTYGNAAVDPNAALIGTFTQTGGTVVTAESNISPNVGNASQLNLIGGTYTSNAGQYASFTVGTRGDGKVFVDGGSLTVNGTTTTPLPGDINQLIVGAQYSGSNTSKNHWFIEQSGSVTTNGLVLGAMSTAAVTGTSGLYYLNGGTLTTSTLNLGTEGAGNTTGTLYFGGGTFKSAAAFSTDPNVTTVINSGGATIDTSGGSVTWSGPLQAGVTGTVSGSTGLTGGSGYFPAPTVTVSPSNTGGAGASATAVINAQGQVVDIVMANPGSGYTTAPTFTITPAAGGTGSGASVNGIAPLTAAGGLTKVGSNVLTLTAQSTYTGPTVISGGTLRLALPAPLVASYSFDNTTNTPVGSPATIVNTGGGGSAMNGTVEDTYTGVNIVSGGPKINGVSGNALQFANDGSTVLIGSGIENLSGGGSWTVSTWIQTTQPGATILSKNSGGFGGGWVAGNSIFYLSNGTGGTVAANTTPASGDIPTAARNGAGYETAATTANVADGNWHMVTYVDNAGNKSIYIDGVLSALSQNGLGTVADVGTQVQLGFSADSTAADGTEQLNGNLDDINFFNTALTASQISNLMSTNSAFGTTAGNVGVNTLSPATTINITTSGGSLDVNGTYQTVASLTGVAGTSVTLGGGQLTVGNAANTTFAGNISDTGSASTLTGGALVKQGAGSLTLSGSDSYSGGTYVTAGTLVLGSASAFPTNTSLNVSSGALVTIANHSTNSTYVPVVSSLTNSGTIDLVNNALLIHNGAVGTINAEAAAGFNNGGWNGTSGSIGVITSSLAAADPTHLTAVGVTTGINGTFEGLTVTSTDVLVKYTYYGDTDLNGKVDASDYSRIDNGYLNHLTGWFNGDFNYDGVVNGSDYTLIDNAYNTQGAHILAQIASPTAEIAEGSAGSGEPGRAVPEPTTLGLLGIGAAGLLGRRRRRSIRLTRVH